MVSCVILHHDSITTLTKSCILRSMFHGEDFEIEVFDQSTTVIFLWNVNKVEIWQAAALFDSTGIQLGYGFGEKKLEARTNAEIVLEKWRGLA